MKISFRDSLISIAIFIIVFFIVFAFPLMIESSKISIAEALILTIPLSFLISFIPVHFQISPKLQHAKNKIFLIGSLLIYAFMSSVIYIISSKVTVARLALFIPVDVVFFIIPLYIFYKLKSETSLNNIEYSQDYTERLAKLISPKEVVNHDVYLSNKPLGRSYAETSNGENWKILLKREAISQLNPEELDSVLLESFLERSGWMTMKLVTFIATYLAIVVDVLLLGSILSSILPVSYDIYVLIMMGASVILIAATPFIVLEFLSFLQSRVDKQVLNHLTRSDSFVSVIEKKSELMIPLRPMTPKQFDRFSKRKERMIKKRIKKIEAHSTTVQ